VFFSEKKDIDSRQTPSTAVTAIRYYKKLFVRCQRQGRVRRPLLGNVLRDWLVHGWLQGAI
jgi:hypothetical protein